jgi:DNA-directed RNA polymerase sigma subunit (sigma70/sigma32)
VDSRVPSAEDALIRRQLTERMRGAMDTLPNRLRRVLSQRYGPGDEAPLNLQLRTR